MGYPAPSLLIDIYSALYRVLQNYGVRGCSRATRRRRRTNLEHQNVATQSRFLVHELREARVALCLAAGSRFTQFLLQK